MQLDTLKAVLIDFANDPCKSWGGLRDGEQFMNGSPARVAIEQGDRNTARLLSGTYTASQLGDFERQLGSVETAGHGTAYFGNFIPDALEYSPTCVNCNTPFASSLREADTCYNCCLLRLCPTLPGRHFQHWWGLDRDSLWTLYVFGDVGFHDTATYWWHNRNSGGNTGHQALVVSRAADGSIKRLVFTTVSQNAQRRYRIIWDLEAQTTRFFTCPRRYVNDDEYTPRSTELDELDALVLDLIVAMTPEFMIYNHRPRNPANGCFM